jgi:hypothetical protein
MIHRKPEPFEQHERDAAQLLHEALFGFGKPGAGTPTLQ